MWKLAAFIAVAVLACLPFTVLGFMFFGPLFLCNIVDWFDHG